MRKFDFISLNFPKEVVKTTLNTRQDNLSLADICTPNLSKSNHSDGIPLYSLVFFVKN